MGDRVAVVPKGELLNGRMLARVSARIDGAPEMRMFIRLVVPLGLPAIASLVVVFAFQRCFGQGPPAGSVE